MDGYGWWILVMGEVITLKEAKYKRYRCSEFNRIHSLGINTQLI